MSPGPTFDRVYLALKEQLRSGRHPPGGHLEPAVLGEELCASITPVRDALHRLVGERLVEAPRNDGFRAPAVTELGLRQLYGWEADLLRLALARCRTAWRHSAGPVQPDPRQRAAAADLFLEIAHASDNPELVAALANTRQRLAPTSALEERFIRDAAEELGALEALWEARDLAALGAALAAYRRRRERIVPLLVAELQRAI